MLDQPDENSIVAKLRGDKAREEELFKSLRDKYAGPEPCANATDEIRMAWDASCWPRRLCFASRSKAMSP
jgi:hypothetical protein